MSRERRSPPPAPLLWAAGMVGIGLAIEALRDGDVAAPASAPIILLLALAFARSARRRSDGAGTDAPR